MTRLEKRIDSIDKKFDIKSRPIMRQLENCTDIEQLKPLVLELRNLIKKTKDEYNSYTIVPLAHSYNMSLRHAQSYVSRYQRILNPGWEQDMWKSNVEFRQWIDKPIDEEEFVKWYRSTQQVHN